MGVAHSINVNRERESFEGLLEEYAVPCEVADQCSDILTRADYQLEKLEQKPEELSDKPPLPPKPTLKEILDEMEKKLSETEDKAQPFIETITSSSNLARKIDQTLRKWKKNRKTDFKSTSLPQKSPQETLLNAGQRLTELERRFAEIDTTATRCSNIVSRTSQISKSLKFNVKEVPIQKVPLPPGEKFFAFIEARLSEIEKALTANKSNEDVTKEVLTIKATVTHLIEQVPHAKADIIKQTLELRNLVEMIKQSIRTNPELKAVHFDLLSLREMAKEIEELIKVESNMGRCGTTVFFEVWVPKAQLEKVVEEIKNIAKGKCVIEEVPPSSKDVVPTVIKPVPRFFEAFEKLTFSLGYPRPEEINPVLLMAVTFPFLFGIMFADVGQGAILLAVGLIILYFRGKVDINKVGDIMRYFIVSGGLFVLCGTSAIIFGFLFGEFFGPSGVLHPILLAEIGPFQIGGFDPMHEPLGMLRFAILIGVIMLSLGLVMRVVNNFKKRRPKNALISSFWIWLLLGGFFIWIYWGGISNITRWFAEGIFMFLGLIATPVALICIVTATSGSIMEGIDFSIEVLIESLDHTISFSRLAALFLTHTALNYMFLIIAGVENGVFTLQSIPIIIVGSILALSIEGLVVFVHCLRLHWVELLPEFYSGKGVPYDPLKVK
ncbi:hypothetical protein AC478_03315 [miscellaneous Crenarchaeota group-1 archaeon SG8-32-3]|uniref:A-type ATP synthase subunit I n=1 Tax=miscellaneous Crenarchaeota group-1 archaeon SG8-32-3 TaxID=1685125 RepID=A0A0M0BRM1_9ARCH|nr:MAG: hypothetical protein AC478_03315 [miscellaneous Crenarchaeota group-1 archaeon SG8-32-3]